MNSISMARRGSAAAHEGGAHLGATRTPRAQRGGRKNSLKYREIDAICLAAQQRTAW
jgi:hypothetical protein